MPPKEAMVRMRPRRLASRRGAMAWVVRSVPRQLIVTISDISCSFVSRKGTGMEWDWPTLLMRIETSRSETKCLRRSKSAGVALA